MENKSIAKRSVVPGSAEALHSEHGGRLAVWLAKSLPALSPEESAFIAKCAIGKAHQRRGSFDTRKSGFSTWLHNIAYRTAVDHLRARKPAIVTVSLDDMPEELLPAPDQDPAIAYQEKARRKRLYRMLRRLPVRERHSIILHYVIGRSYPEAAARLNITVAQVRHAIKKGIALLRENRTQLL